MRRRTGAKGDKGDRAILGIRVWRVHKGDKGDTGAMGATGDKGDKGDTGAMGATGDKGDTGAMGVMGDKGDKGDTGAQGPAGNFPALGQFFATQIVQGAVLTCASVSVTATIATCSGPKVNGLDVRLGTAEAGAICAAVTARSFNTGIGMGATANPYVIWTGSAWMLSSVANTPLLTLNCDR